MAYDPVKPFYTAVTSGLSLSSALDVGTTYRHMSLGIPSMASGSDIQIQVSDAIDGTYRTLFHGPTVTSGTVSMVIASGVSNCVVPIPALHHRYLKVRLTSATSDTAYTFTVYGA